MKNLFLIGAVLFTTLVAVADDTTTETCANGAGTVIEGAVADANGNKHKYCMSNKTMNFWNAYAWCDALGRRLFQLSDCRCDNMVADCAKNMCLELNKGIDKLVLTSNSFTTATVYSVRLSDGNIGFGSSRNHRADSGTMHALCY